MTLCEMPAHVTGKARKEAVSQFGAVRGPVVWGDMQRDEKLWHTLTSKMVLSDTSEKALKKG